MADQEKEILEEEIMEEGQTAEGQPEDAAEESLREAAENGTEEPDGGEASACSRARRISGAGSSPARPQVAR